MFSRHSLFSISWINSCSSFFHLWYKIRPDYSSCKIWKGASNMWYFYCVLCDHRSKWTFLVGKIFIFANRLRSTHCREVLLGTMQTHVRYNYSIITSPWPWVVAGFAYYVIQRNDTINESLFICRIFSPFFSSINIDYFWRKKNLKYFCPPSPKLMMTFFTKQNLIYPLRFLYDIPIIIFLTH